MNTPKNIFHYLADWQANRQAQTETEATTEKPHTKPATRLRHWLTPNGGTLILVLLLILTQNIWARPGAAPNTAVSNSATTINYQGRLADSGGNPINDTVSLSFSVYDAAENGNLIWGPESHSAVSVSDGLFNVGLGSQTTNGIPTNIWNGDRYLEISVDGEALSPREEVRSVPFAMVANEALTVPNGSITSEKIATGAITQALAPTLVSSNLENSHIQYGSTRVSISSNTSRVGFEIDYDDYPARPVISALPGFNHTPNVTVTFGEPCGNTKCTIFFQRTDGGQWSAGQRVDLMWMAIGPKE